MKDDNPKYMRLANGDLIDTATGKRIASTEINQAFSDTPIQPLKVARKKPLLTEGRRRYLDDLPTPPDQSRAVAIVASYGVFGLSSADIAFILRVDVDLVEQVQESEAYAKFIDGMLANIREFDQDKVRKKINAAALDAAGKVVELAKSQDEKIALAAARDVLDRAGNNDATARSGNANGGLVIRIIDDRDNPAAKLDVDVF